jgi:hypothetical protein
MLFYIFINNYYVAIVLVATLLYIYELEGVPKWFVRLGETRTTQLGLAVAGPVDRTGGLGGSFESGFAVAGPIDLMRGVVDGLPLLGRFIVRNGR